MSESHEFDRRYALSRLRILASPTHRLETFGNTLVNYHFISELDDYPGKVRIREGRIESHKPIVLTPHVPEVTAEGLSPAAFAYLKFLKENEENLRILQYGCHLKSDNFSEQIVTDTVAAVAERVKSAVAASNDQFAAVLVGVDEPWDVALVELWRREVERSSGMHIKELRESGRLFGLE